MESINLTAEAQVTINASVERVWDALTDPGKIKKYMFETTVISDWKEGSEIIWKGEWGGKIYEDKGVILEFEPNNKIQYSHYSALTGLPDIPENYHTITIKLTDKDGQTVVSLVQENNTTEQAKEYSEKNWKEILTGLKDLLEE